MYIEMNPTGLTLSDLICVAHRKRSEDTGFPYAVQSCRCSNCRYVGEGKCSLKECCCMAERVRAHTCTFTEILNTCFANVKDNVFHYRLRLAAERATMTKTCFLDREHRARFLKALHRVRGNERISLHNFLSLPQPKTCGVHRKRQSQEVVSPILTLTSALFRRTTIFSTALLMTSGTEHRIRT